MFKPASYLAALLSLAWATALFAHDPGLSSIRLTANPDGLEAIFTIHAYDLEAVAPDLDGNHDGRLEPAELSQALPALERLARRVLNVTGNGASFALLGDPRVALIENNNVQMHLRFAPGPPGAALTFSSSLIADLPHGHRQFVEMSASDGKETGEGFLSASVNQLVLNVPATGAAAAAGPMRFGQFFFLGVNHLLTGYDHLLFLAGLLIVCRSLFKAFEMLTLFTIAHSVTLTLVTLNMIKAPSSIIEPMIAASIAYIGVENILRPNADLSWRGVLTFTFGLIHGMGFAGALRELGVGQSGGGVFRPLLFFSLGLESTQLGLAAAVFPLLLWLRTMPSFPRWWVPAFSGFIAMAGALWFVERVFFTSR